MLCVWLRRWSGSSFCKSSIVKFKAGSLVQFTDRIDADRLRNAFIQLGEMVSQVIKIVGR